MAKKPDNDDKKGAKKGAAKKAAKGGKGGGQQQGGKKAKGGGKKKKKKGPAPVYKREQPPSLKQRYDDEIAGKLIKEFNYSSSMEVPRLVKITLKFKKRGRAGPRLIAKLKLLDGDGRPVPGERLFGRWFGKISEPVECTTDRKGRCTVVRPLSDSDGRPGDPGAVDAIAGFTVDRSAGAAGLGTTPQGFVDFLRKLWLRWLSVIAYRFGLDVQLDPEPVNTEPDLSTKDEPDDLIGAQGLGTTPVGFRFDWRLIGFRTENPFVFGAGAAQARDASVGGAPVQP